MINPDNFKDVGMKEYNYNKLDWKNTDIIVCTTCLSISVFGLLLGFVLGVL